MTDSLASPGDIVNLRRSATNRKTSHLTVVSTRDVEIIQLLIPAGSSIPTYEAAGETILHRVEGRISLSFTEEPRELIAGQLLCLAINEPFSILGLEHASVLVTIIEGNQRGRSSPNLGRMADEKPAAQKSAFIEGG